MKGLYLSRQLVPAVLSGAKTQTRRVMNPQPAGGLRYSPFVKSGLEDGHGREMRPRYLPGEIVYLRESVWLPPVDTDYEVTYCADWDAAYLKEALSNLPAQGWRFRPARFMPKSAHRALLEILEVRGQRLQDITPEDAIAEGFPHDPTCHYPVLWFRNLWDSINKAHPWESNPWVWPYTFRRVK